MKESKEELAALGQEKLDHTPPPLADPVFTAIFQNADVSGRAMKSLINACLEDSGDAPISDVITVTPQQVHTDTGRRGYRIDVEAKTADGEIVLCDVQMTPFPAMNKRSLLYSEQSLASRARRGEKISTVVANMPRVIVLNMLDFAIRLSGKKFHQVVELAYREAPRERAVENLEIHHLQLPKFREIVPDYGRALHCWLTAICKAQEEKITLKEVVDMDAGLKAYCDADPGFAEFVKRHSYVAALPEVHKEYKTWQIEQILQDENDAWHRKEGMEELAEILINKGLPKDAINDALAQAKAGKRTAMMGDRQKRTEKDSIDERSAPSGKTRGDDGWERER